MNLTVFTESRERAGSSEYLYGVSSSEHDGTPSPGIPSDLENETSIAALQYIESCVVGGLGKENQQSLKELSKNALASGPTSLRSIFVLCGKDSPDAQKIHKCVQEKLRDLGVGSFASPVRDERKGETPLPPGWTPERKTSSKDIRTPTDVKMTFSSIAPPYTK